VPREWIDQVSTLFPHLPRQVIEQDLMRTRSVEQTCERILSGQLRVPSTPASVRAIVSFGLLRAAIET
jgi:hypothetical protein